MLRCSRLWANARKGITLELCVRNGAHDYKTGAERTFWETLSFESADIFSSTSFQGKHIIICVAHIIYVRRSRCGRISFAALIVLLLFETGSFLAVLSKLQ